MNGSVRGLWRMTWGQGLGSVSCTLFPSGWEVPDQSLGIPIWLGQWFSKSVLDKEHQYRLTCELMGNANSLAHPNLLNWNTIWEWGPGVLTSNKLSWWFLCMLKFDNHCFKGMWILQVGLTSWKIVVCVLAFFFYFKYLFIYFGCVGSSLLHVGSFSCGMRTLSCGMLVGSSSLTRDLTRAPCIGSTESYPLDHQGSPVCWLYLQGKNSI